MDAGMSMNRDHYRESKYLTKKQRFADIDECLAYVRRAHDKSLVSMEGSTGAERSFWAGGGLVAHAWPVRGSTDFCLRSHL